MPPETAIAGGAYRGIVTERKPPGLSWETWVDRQVREAAEQGAFDDLPGKGKPLADLDAPYDELWWVKQKLRRENLSVLPPTLALRKDVEDALGQLSRVPSEAAVRRLVGQLNADIVRVNATAMGGPPSRLMPLDAEEVVRRWRVERAAVQEARTAAHRPQPTSVAEPPRRRRRLWRRSRAAS